MNYLINKWYDKLKEPYKITLFMGVVSSFFTISAVTGQSVWGMGIVAMIISRLSYFMQS